MENKKMNIYLIKLMQCGYDEYDGWVVQAENEERVLQLCEIEETSKEALAKHWQNNRFKGNVEEIKLIGTAIGEKEEIILGSFNAG